MKMHIGLEEKDKVEYVKFNFDLEKFDIDILHRFMTYLIDIDQISKSFVQYKMVKKDKLNIECIFRYEKESYDKIEKFLNEMYERGYEMND